MRRFVLVMEVDEISPKLAEWLANPQLGEGVQFKPMEIPHDSSAPACMRREGDQLIAAPRLASSWPAVALLTSHPSPPQLLAKLNELVAAVNKARNIHVGVS